MILALEHHSPDIVGQSRPPQQEQWRAGSGNSRRPTGIRRDHHGVSEPEIAVDREHDHFDMARLANGDDQALNSLMERYNKKLLRHVERIVRNRSDAQQLVLETFVRVHRHRLNYKFELRFSTWLFVIATNLALSLLRWRARQPEQVPLPEPDEAENEKLATDSLIDPTPIPVEQAGTNEWTEALEEALAKLPEHLRVPLLRVALDGCSQAEVAEQLGCSVKAVETRVYHARQRLRLDMDRILHPARAPGEAPIWPRKGATKPSVKEGDV